MSVTRRLLAGRIGRSTDRRVSDAEVPTRLRSLIRAFTLPQVRTYQWIEHHFEVDPARRELRIWEQWLRKDTPLLFNGAYELTGDRLVITGTFDDNASPVRLELIRLRNR